MKLKPFYSKSCCVIFLNKSLKIIQKGKDLIENTALNLLISCKMRITDLCQESSAPESAPEHPEHYIK